MLSKLKAIYTKNKLLGIFCWIIAMTIAFYGVFFALGYIMIKYIWKLKIPNPVKVAILVIPILFTSIVGTAWTSVMIGTNKPKISTQSSQSSQVSQSSSSVISSSSVSSQPGISSTIQSSQTQSVQSQVVSSAIISQSVQSTQSTTPEVKPNIVQSTQSNTNSELVKVLQVVDGDTIKVEKYGTLRLIGLDTPETKDPRKPVQCFGKEASQNAQNKLGGHKVRLEFDPSNKIDKYNRTLAYVIREDGYDYNYNAILDGYAVAYTKYPHPKMEAYINADRTAREQSRGLWASATCNGDPTQPAKDNIKTSPTIPTVNPTQNQTNQNIKPKIENGKGAVIKTTSSGRCHNRGSTGYNSTKTYTNYDTMETCLASGGK